MKRPQASSRTASRRSRRPIAAGFDRSRFGGVGKPVLSRVTEDETAAEDAPSHAGIAGNAAHLLTPAVDLVRTAPTGHSRPPRTMVSPAATSGCDRSHRQMKKVGYWAFVYPLADWMAVQGRTLRVARLLEERKNRTADQVVASPDYLETVGFRVLH